MTIYHDIYSFDLQGFENFIKATFSGGYPTETQVTTLRNKVGQLFDNNEFVGYLADIYGNWDKEAVLQDIDTFHETLEEKISWGIQFVLYGYLQPDSDDGFGAIPHQSYAYFVENGYSSKSAFGLVYGAKFQEFIKFSSLKAELGHLLDESNINGTASTLGFWHISELATIMETFRAMTSANDNNSEVIQRVQSNIIPLLEKASQENASLCLIASG